MSKEFRGSYGVLVTPFTEGGKSVDTAALKNLLDWQIKSKSPGVIVLGTTGEFLTISDDERRTIIETTVKHIDGRIDVLVGTTNAYTPNAVRYSKEAQELGANGLMILPPYYYTPTHDEIYNYYKALCGVVSIPIMIYNNPFTSNVDIPVPSGNITFGVSGVGNLIVISTQTANIRANTTSIDKFTGAVVVGGGLGVNGNVFGGALFDNSQSVLNVVSVINGGTY